MSAELDTRTNLVDSDEADRNEELLDGCTNLLRQTVKRITGSQTEWTSFLAMSGRLYKYSFPEQIMIYAQRPDAVACAGMETWNQKMHRYIRAGSSAIALLDTSSKVPAICYVFDIADTEAATNARRPWLWQYRDREHRDVVMTALEKLFGSTVEDDMAARLDEISEKLAQEYWDYHKEEILEASEGSFLEEYDEFNVEVAFCHTASVGIAYAIMSRCALEPEEYFSDREDFEHVFEFNTPATISALGNAVSESSESVLREIERTIRRFELEKRTERSDKRGQQSDLRAGRGLSASQSDTGRSAVQTSGQIWTAAQGVSAPAEECPLGNAADHRETVSAPDRDRGRCQQTSARNSAHVNGSGGRDRRMQNPRSRILECPDGRMPNAGGGDNSAGNRLCLKQSDTVQKAVFPSEQEQIRMIKKAETASVISPTSSRRRSIAR